MAAGGIPVLKALSVPLAHCRFYSTGGVTPATAGEWLAVGSVLCVGGSWIVPAGPLDMAVIQHNAAAAQVLRL
jgi:2-dehydro-3-deoxyphosphogluconate aldolase / (4S)-4-hydroxy-2-oxoglutarate aldolase